MNPPPILLVEDNPMDVDLTVRAFTRSRVANPVVVARDGQEALDYLARWEAGERPPIVVLLDLRLPKVSGVEVLRQMKSHATFGTVPVVVLTSSTRDEDVRLAYEAGANSYIIKPVDFTKFAEVAAQIELYWTMLNHPQQLP